MTTQPMGSGASTGTATSWNARPSSTAMLALAELLSDLSSAGYSNDRAAPSGLSVSEITWPSKIDEHHGVGADARAVIGERRGDRAGVVGRNGFAEREVRCQHARRELELLGVLVEQASEHALTDIEFFGDLGLGIA